MPQALAEPHPDLVRAYQRQEHSKAPQDAAVSPSAPPAAAIDTAALQHESAAAADECRTLVLQAGAEPVRFARGKVKLDRHSRAVLDRLAKAVSSCPYVRLEISGHADAKGAARRNLSLSERRARVVVSYLITKGIDAGRLIAVGYGETRPLAPNDSAQNRAKNRRIEIEVKAQRPLQQGPVTTVGQGAG